MKRTSVEMAVLDFDAWRASDASRRGTVRLALVAFSTLTSAPALVRPIVRSVLGLFVCFAVLTAAIFWPNVAIMAQPAAGPDANPLKRMDCPTAGEIRDDGGLCVDVEVYFSTDGNRVYWVDQASGDDLGSGTKARPWKTIRRATTRGVLRPGDAVIIRGGIYREEIHPQVEGRPGRLITFAAYPGEEVVVSGADPLRDGWTRAGDAWRHSWGVPLKAHPNNGTVQQRPEFRREMVISDGQVLEPVYSRSDLKPGSFYVEGTDVNPTAILLRLHDDANPNERFVEVGRRSALFLPLGAREDWCGGEGGRYRLVGLTFRHAVNNANWAAVCSGVGSLLEEVTAEWTNGTGIEINRADVIMRGNRANYNGMGGVGGRCTGCLLEYNETAYNNWKGHAYGYAASGVKLIYTNRTTIRYHLSYENDGTGIWLDVNNADNVIDYAVVVNNAARGILLEANTVGTTVRNSYVSGTKLRAGQGTGIQSQAASHNTISENTITGNEGFGIWIRMDDRAEDGYNTIVNNLLVQNATLGRPQDAEIRIDGDSLPHVRTNVIDGNRYVPRANSGHTFIIRSDDGTTYRGDDIAKWRKLTGGDAGSVVLDPSDVRTSLPAFLNP